jgi:uncharacterized protein
VLAIENTGKKGGQILYNTINGSKVLITPKQEMLIKQKRNSEKLKGLWEKGYIVRDDYDEKEYVYKGLSNISKTYNLTVLPTYECNMKCEYCFESHVAKESMEKKHIGCLIDRIIQKIEYDKKTKIRIAFTGGEPLIRFNFIKLFFEQFQKKVLGKYNIDYEITVITNGSLLNRRIINFLKQNNCVGIQVTLDGVKEKHDRLRRLKNGDNSYELIIDNINAFMTEIPFVIRSNYKVGEEKELYSFIDELAEKINDRKLIKLKLRSIMDTLENRQYTKQSKNIDNLGKVIEYAFKKGIEVLQGSICDMCRIYSSSNEYIVPNGYIYRCLMLVGYEQFAIGNIFEKVRNGQEEFFNNLNIWKSCLDCPIVSLCAGGCRYEAYVKTGDITKKLCKYKEIKELTTKFIKAKYIL